MLVVLFGAAAAIWTARAVVDVVYGVPAISMAVFLLDILCAVVWAIAFVAQLLRCRFRKKDE